MPLAGKVSDYPVDGIQRLTQLKTGPVYGLAKTGLFIPRSPLPNGNAHCSTSPVSMSCVPSRILPMPALRLVFQEGPLQAEICGCPSLALFSIDNIQPVGSCRIGLDLCKSMLTSNHLTSACCS